MLRNSKFFCALIVIISSCTFNYEEAMFDSEINDQIPKTVLINFKQITEKDDENTVVMEAERAENFDQLQKTIITALHFFEMDDLNNKLIEGWAGKAVYFTETENAEVYDSIYIYSFSENAGLNAESLIWNKDNKLLTSGEDSIVTLEKDDGSIVSGRGFKADLRRKDIDFNSAIFGTYITEEDNE